MVKSTCESVRATTVLSPSLSLSACGVACLVFPRSLGTSLAPAQTILFFLYYLPVNPLIFWERGGGGGREEKTKYEHPKPSHPTLSQPKQNPGHVCHAILVLFVLITIVYTILQSRS